MDKRNKWAKEDIDEIIKLRKEQIKTLEAGLIKPLRDSIKAAEKAKTGEISYYNFIKGETNRSKQVNGLLRLNK
jgi:hypothetical protein